MKKTITILFVLALVLGFSMHAHAALIDNGDGTITDTDRQIMYYDFSYSAVDWDDAMNWADNLVAAGYDDWRLPSALNSDDSGPCSDPNQCNDSELGHLYYIELGLPYGTEMNNSNNGPFNNIPVYSPSGFSWYWTETSASDTDAWVFILSNGRQHTHEKYVYWEEGQAVAVRSILPEALPHIMFDSSGLVWIAVNDMGSLMGNEWELVAMTEYPAFTNIGIGMRFNNTAYNNEFGMIILADDYWYAHGCYGNWVGEGTPCYYSFSEGTQGVFTLTTTPPADVDSSGAATGHR